MCGFSTMTVPAIACEIVDSLIEFLLGNVLNILVDGEDDALSRFRLLFHVGEPALARIDGMSILPGLPRSSSSNSCSMPLWPESSMPTVPTTWAAKSRAG